MSRLGVFGYGSLVSRDSVAATLGRDAAPPLPARLAGWHRRWSIFRDNKRVEKEFERLDGQPFRHCLGLNLERAPEAAEAEWPNGALIEVTRAELDRLDLRELRYDRVDVSEGIRTGSGACAGGGGTFDAVYAFVAKPEHFAPETPPRSIIIASYLRACEEAFDQLGPGERDLFAATTGPPPVPVVEARLVRDAIPKGNPRDW